MRVIASAIAAIAAILLAVVAPSGQTNGHLVEFPPAQHVSLNAPAQLAVTCTGHLGEAIKGSPYLLDCSQVAPPSTTTTTVAPTTTTTAPANGLPPVASLLSGSIFNRPVTGWSVSSNSAAWVADFVTDYQTHYGSVGVNTLPLYEVPAGTPLSAMSVRSGCGDFRSSTGSEVPVPAFSDLNGSSDNPLALYDPSTDQLWEFWQAGKTSSGYQACWGGGAPLTSFSGVFGNPFGLSATGISYLATTVTENDVAQGSIDHAVSVILPPNCSRFVPPAVRGDCSGTSGQPSEGQWFRFAPGTPMPGGLTPFAQMVFRAISIYGMVVTDQGGAVMLEAEQSSDWAAQGHSGTDPITTSWAGKQEYQVVANLPWADLQVLNYPAGVPTPPHPPAPYFRWPGNGPT